MRNLPQYWPWLLLASLCSATFALSCHLSTLGPLNGRGEAASSVADLVFGRARGAFSSSFYETADQCFHKGVPHKKQRAFENSPFQRVLRGIAPDGHYHLQGGEVSEMMPWLALSIRMDPGNIEVYRVAAFWLASSAGRPDLAHDVLRQAHQRNPQSYQIRLDMGRMALKEGKWGEAADDMDAALRLWPHREGVDPELALFEKAEVLLHRALLHETEGQMQEAMRSLRQIAEIFPGRDVERQRLDDLEQGRIPPVTAAELLNHLAETHDKRMSTCSHEHEHEHEHAHEHTDSCADARESQDDNH